jgi:[ribosomal protein S5]-alanine N-acetyltransferase
MTGLQVPGLRTERVLLRGFEQDDLATWNQMLFADPEVRRFLPITEPLTDDELTGFLQRTRAHWLARGYGIWAACDANSGGLMGHCGLRHLPDVDETELLYALARPHWGTGLATEAAVASLAFGFERAGLTRVVAYAVPENRASTRVMEKVGMEFEAETDIFGLHCARYAIQRSP